MLLGPEQFLNSHKEFHTVELLVSSKDFMQIKRTINDLIEICNWGNENLVSDFTYFIEKSFSDNQSFTTIRFQRILQNVVMIETAVFYFAKLEDAILFKLQHT